MAICPFADVELLPKERITGEHITKHRRLDVHVQAGLGDLHDFYDVPGRPSSHFQIRKSGQLRQFVDTDLEAEGDYEGNSTTISCELEGGTGTTAEADREAMTDAQFKTLVRLFVWCHKVHDIPLVLASTSKTDSSSNGLSWHRLGIDGNWPALPDPAAGRMQRGGGLRYSKSFGKICPGLAKIKQLPAVVREAKASVTPAPLPRPTLYPRDADTHPGAVKRVQVALNLIVKPVPALVVDGKYGEFTQAAVRRFKKMVGLTPNHVFGPRCYREAAKRGAKV